MTMRNYISILLLLIYISIPAAGQTADFVQTDGIRYPIHQANIGMVTFMNGNIPIDTYKETDFLSTFPLTYASDLNIRVFLGNSITNYLHPLAPGWTADELNKKGN